MSDLPDTMEDCRREIERLTAVVASFRRLAKRIRLVAKIETKPLMSYSGARYERQLDELIADDTGQKLLDQLDALAKKVTPDLNYWVVTAERQTSRADAAERQADWLRLVAWGLASGVLMRRESCWTVKKFSPAPEGCEGLVYQYASIVVARDKDGIPEQEPTLEAALTAARESTRSTRSGT